MDFESSTTTGHAPDKSAFVPARAGQARTRPQKANGLRSTRSLEQRIYIGAADVALMAGPGRVDLPGLNDTDWKRQLSDFLHKYGRNPQRGSKVRVSEETLRNRTDQMFRTVRELVHVKDVHVRCLGDCKPRLLPRMFQLWDELNIGKRAQINYFNTWRWFWRMAGIEIQPIAHYARTPGEFTIDRNAQQDKSWAGNGVDVQAIIEQIEQEDPVAARLVRMMSEFGLRLKEAIRLEPHEADGGDRLNITKGAKNGRPREIVFGNLAEADYRAVIDQAKEEVPRLNHMAWARRSLKQAKQRMYTLSRKYGLTKHELGVTWHGLRHEFAIDQLEKQTGELAPVRGGRFSMLTLKQTLPARERISGALGHNRPWVTGAYYGSSTTAFAQEQRNFESSWTLLNKALDPHLDQLLQASGADNLFLVGVRAQGLSMDKHVPFHLLLPSDVKGPRALLLAEQVAPIVRANTGVDCIVQLWDHLPTTEKALYSNKCVPLVSTYDPVDSFKEMTKRRQSEALRTAPLVGLKREYPRHPAVEPQGKGADNSRETGIDSAL